ncbi:hypothetical protein D3C83_05000 [compost metagenome]
MTVEEGLQWIEEPALQEFAGVDAAVGVAGSIEVLQDRFIVVERIDEIIYVPIAVRVDRHNVELADGRRLIDHDAIIILLDAQQERDALVEQGLADEKILDAVAEAIEAVGQRVRRLRRQIRAQQYARLQRLEACTPGRRSAFWRRCPEPGEQPGQQPAGRFL